MEDKSILRKVAKLILAQYALNIKSIQYFTEETNLFFKVIDGNEKKYALKIFQEESSKIEDNLAEVFFMDAVNKASNVPIPDIVHSINGDGVVVAKSKYTPLPKRAILYEWIEGEVFCGKESYRLFRKMGKTIAKMHTATKDISIPENLNPKKWDKVFYYRGEVPVYKKPEFKNVVSDEFIKTMDYIIPVLDNELNNLYENSNPQLIHADLNPWNILIDGDELKIIDFEEALLGLPVHDISVFLYYYKYSDKFDYSLVKNSLLEGYSEIINDNDFNEFYIDLLMTARRVNFMNYVLDINHDD
ncbi:MAG: hypothetical protein PWQ77_1795, partial [Kosmotogales bacterium]|nr:hypothetical protein [Kosmotogales bacterium]